MSNQGIRWVPAAVAALVVLLAGPSGAADRGSSGEGDLRICLDVEDVNGPQWQPDGSEERGDPFVSEIILRFAERLSSDGQVRTFGIRELYDVLGPRESTESIAEAVGATHYLRGFVDQYPQRQSFRIRLSLESVATGKRKRVSYKGKLPISSREVGDLVAKLLKQQGVAVRLPDDALEGYARFDFDHHVRNAHASIFRLVGRRYGTPRERGLLQRADSYLDETPTPDSAHLDAALEKTALLFRQYNLSNDETYRREADDLLVAFAAADRESARYHLLLAQGEYWRTGNKEAVNSELATALELDPNLAEASFLIGFLRARNLKVDATEAEVLEVVVELEAAITNNPALLRAYAYLARTHGLTGDDRQAQRTFDELFRIRDYPLGLYQKAVIEWRRHDLDAALDALSRIEFENSGFYRPDVRRMRALIEFSRERYVPAELTLVTGLAVDEPHLVEMYRKGLDAGDEARAARQFEDVRDAVSDRIRARGEFVEDDEIILGLTAARLGEREVAREFADNLRVRFPEKTNIDVWIGIATMYRLIGEEEYAQAFVEWAHRGQTEALSSR